jgi:hypothetical protein
MTNVALGSSPAESSSAATLLAPKIGYIDNAPLNARNQFYRAILYSVALITL